MQSLYPQEKNIVSYWKHHSEEVSRRFKKNIRPIFDEAKARINSGILDVLNNRRYNSIDDKRKRYIRAKSDPKIKQINDIIKATNAKVLRQLYADLETFYKDESSVMIKAFYPWLAKIADINPTLSNAEAVEMRNNIYQGNTYAGWIKDNTESAIKAWNSAFRLAMTGDMDDKAVFILKELEKALNTNESRDFTVYNNAMIEVSRKIQRDIEGELWG